MQCLHYYVTWDPKFPRGCKAFKFKSSAMPSAAVLTSSGKPCMNFEAKLK
nr:uracil-DNA glycosylase [Paenibacillus lignilyticus]